MSRRTLVIAIAVVAVAALITTLVIVKYPNPNDNTHVKIGFVGALSGPASYIGIEIQRGGELAVEEINAQGGVNGRKLVIISRDDQHEPKKTVAQYRELVEEQQVVAMLGATNSASMLAVEPLVNSTLKVPVICPATDASAITDNEARKQGRDNYLFRVGMDGEGQANFMVDTAIKKFGFTRVALLTWTGGWGVTGRGEITRRIRELGQTPVADETYAESDTDMTAQLLKIKAANAQCILNYGLVRENSFVAKSREQLRYQTPYMSAWGLAGAAFWEATGPAAEGTLVSTTVTLDGPQDKRRQGFIDRYRERYKEEIKNPVFAVGAYDAVYLFKAAMERRGTEPGQIRAGLEDIPTFSGLLRQFDRPVFTRERHNALTEADMILGRWTEGKLLPVRFDEAGAYVEAGGAKRYLDPATMKLK